MEAYKQLYDDIINNAKVEEKLRLRAKKGGAYYERHHILPKSLFPLSAKDPNNMVLLTASEHFRCHQYLTHVYPGPEMSYALHSFVTRPNSNYKITEEEYAEIKKDYAKRISERQRGKFRPREVIEKSIATKKKNGTLSTASRPEVRAKISSSLKGRPSPFKGAKKPGWYNSATWVTGCTPWNKGKKCEMFAKNGADNPSHGKHWYTNGKDNILEYECPSGYYPGRTLHIDQEKEKVRRQKISESGKGNHWFNNGVKNILRVECPPGYVPGFLTPRVYREKD